MKVQVTYKRRGRHEQFRAVFEDGHAVDFVTSPWQNDQFDLICRSPDGQSVVLRNLASGPATHRLRQLAGEKSADLLVKWGWSFLSLPAKHTAQVEEDFPADAWVKLSRLYQPQAA